MFKDVKISKIVIVIFITVLIWVWADLAQDEEIYDIPAVVTIDDSTNPRLWVRFDRARRIEVSLSLIGPHASIVELEQLIKEQQQLEFSFSASQQLMTAPGNYPLNLVNFFEDSKFLEQKGLRILSCEPSVIQVEVDQLVEKNLSVRCIDENQTPVVDATLEPPTIPMYVPQKWNGPAVVQMSQAELRQSRSTPVKKTPFVEIDDMRKTAAVKVEVKTPAQQERLTEYIITAVTPGFSFSPNTQGKYKVNLINDDVVMGSISIKATPEAKRAYDDQRYQVILEIEDGDVLATEPIRRQLKYNFPDRFVEAGEIILNQPPDIARFNLIPIETQK